MADLTLGDYELDDDSNGNFVLKDKNDNIVLQWDSNNAEWNLNDVGSVDGGGSAVNIDDDLDLQSSQNLSNVQSLSTEEVKHTQPTGTYDWQDVNYILEQGGVVTSTGKVFQGSSAVQDAFDSEGDDTVYHLGKRTYDPVKTDISFCVIQGCGHQTKIKGGSSHALEINDPATRNVWKDIMLNVPKGGGNASDALHIEVTGGSRMYEQYFERVQLQESDRHGVNIIGSSNADVVGMWFHELFGEGIDEKGIVGNQYVVECEVTSADLVVDSNTNVIDWDGGDSMFVGSTFKAAAGSTPTIKFGSNSYNNAVVTPSKTQATPIDNGFDNWYIARRHSKLPTRDEVAATVEKSTDQSISATTSTTVDWDNQNLDSGLYSYDSTNDTIDVLQAGDYQLSLAGTIQNISDQDLARYEVYINGANKRNIQGVSSGTNARWSGSVTLKDLSKNDTIRLDLWTESAGSILGSTQETWASLSKL